jgi:hypothetical protein
MDQLQMKRLAEIYDVKLTASIINFATQCYGSGYSDGREQQKQVDLKKDEYDNTDIRSD